ncbi:MAG: alpha/beta fold hydrolase [Candidatus Dormibacteria bacterium]
MSVELAHSLIGDPDQPMLVMSSALGTSRAMWDAQHALGTRFSLLLYDHRGLGESPAPPGPYSVEDLGADLIALLDRLGVASAGFCGVSLGGMVGLWAAARHPERISRLVVIAALPRLQPAAKYTERAGTVRAGGIGPIASGVVARWFTARFATEHPATVVGFATALAGMDAEGYASCCEAVAACDLRMDIRRIDARTLIIAGAEDPFVPAASAVIFGASFRDASVAVVPDAAHLVNVEQPDIVNRLVLDHLTGDDGGAV